MTAVTNNTNNVAAAAQASGRATLNGDFNMFLKLLTTQLQNQDPLKPMDSSEFTQQLVSYSQVEQAIKGNEKLEALATMLGGQTMSQAVSLIGRDVAIDMPTSVLGDTGARWQYTLAAPGTETKLSILDQNGNVVRTLNGEVAGGDHNLNWDGKNDAGEPMAAGLYTLKVETTNSAGNQIQSWVSAKGLVQSVHFENGEPLLDLGGASVRLSEVVTVRQA